jgi:hypothetical protein
MPWPDSQSDHFYGCTHPLKLKNAFHHPGSKGLRTTLTIWKQQLQITNQVAENIAKMHLEQPICPPDTA